MIADRNHVPGNAHGSTVGSVSLGAIARQLLELLSPFDLNVLVHDPFLTEHDAAVPGVRLVSLETIFQRSDVVSLHTPVFPETVGMIAGQHFAVDEAGGDVHQHRARRIGPRRRMLEMLNRSTRHSGGARCDYRGAAGNWIPFL